MVKVILLPVKDPEQAKQRLAGLLSPGERKDLAWAMLADVAAAVRGCRLADRIVVVARDPEVAGYAVENGWEVFREREQVSESRSVDWASRLLEEAGSQSGPPAAGGYSPGAGPGSGCPSRSGRPGGCSRAGPLAGQAWEPTPCSARRR